MPPHRRRIRPDAASMAAAKTRSPYTHVSPISRSANMSCRLPLSRQAGIRGRCLVSFDSRSESRVSERRLGPTEKPSCSCRHRPRRRSKTFGKVETALDVLGPHEVPVAVTAALEGYRREVLVWSQ